MRHIEHQRLSEEHEWHPLVVGMMFDIVIRIYGTDAGMRYISRFQ